MNFVIHRNELSHHGILGQKWGKKNGPPYPLDYQDHSTKEKRLMTKTQKEKARDEKPSKSGLDIDKKRLMKQAAIAAGLALAVAGGYALYESGALNKLASVGKSYVKGVDLGDKVKSFQIDETNKKSGPLLSRIKRNSLDVSKLGKSYEDIDEKMVVSINAENLKNGTQGGNCPAATATYFLNSFFGGDFKAVGMPGVPKEGAETISDIFKLESMKQINPAPPNSDAFMGVKMGEKVFDKIPNGSTGFLHTYHPLYGDHDVVYEKTLDGVISLVENKYGFVFTGESLESRLNKYGFCKWIVDCSNLELRDDLTDEMISKYSR